MEWGGFPGRGWTLRRGRAGGQACGQLRQEASSEDGCEGGRGPAGLLEDGAGSVRRECLGERRTQGRGRAGS